MTAQSTHVDIVLNQAVLQSAIGELELKNPPSFKLHSHGKVDLEGDGRYVHFRGLYSPAQNLVTIANGFQAYSRERQPELVKHLSFTILHELRHAWQRENWSPAEQLAMASGPYELRGEEQDANVWAEYAQPKFAGLVRVKRRPVGGQSRFAKASGRWSQ